MSVDPLAAKYPSLAPYTYTANNPILFIDPNGEEYYVNQYGEIRDDWKVWDQEDPSVYQVIDNEDGSELMFMGEVGGDLYVEDLFENSLDRNMEFAEGIWNPFTFNDLVTDEGDWDIKLNKNTIYGIGYEAGSDFHFKNWTMSAEDMGNYHYGATGLATPIFNKWFLLMMAGKNQLDKGRSKPEWQNGWQTPFTPPYGDDPVDQLWIRRGFDYYYNSKK